ncbi:hypothetical protein N9B57_05260 [Verrucomicrobia bacterium]|jgi:hypothetical protein|nr:hypothetical protein [Verrucomicrobiota bacterium]
MRVYLSVWSLLLIGFLSACGPGKTKVDSASLTPAFSGASADVQGQISAVVSAVTANDYEKALSPLRNVITKGKITDEQRAALTTVLADMQRVVAENQGDFSMDVYNGLSDLVGILSGNPPIKM